MPLRDRVARNAYFRNYMKRRWQQRRAVAIQYLGGECVECGTTAVLEFDHIDRATKRLSVAKMSSASDKRFWAEVDKCQLLCKPHHIDKHRHEYGRQG